MLFPCIILAFIWIFLILINFIGGSSYNEYGEAVYSLDMDTVNGYFMSALPWVVIGVGVWFFIAYFANSSMIRNATGARPLQRRENPRVYNIVENLTMTCGMDMPQINIIDDPQLNAFASGIDNSTYTVTVTTGLLNLLDDRELAGVIGHELTHIRNRDTRLLITSIIFVGILSTAMSMLYNIFSRTLFWGGTSSRRNNEKGGGVSYLVIMLIGLICCALAYFFTLLTRFAISRKREFMADAGGAELCGDPLALASALRKISGNPGLGDTQREDIAQLFIIKPEMNLSGFQSFMGSLFSTHPDISERIRILEQF